MDSNKRFDQIESLLVDLARKVDQQGEAIVRVEHRLDKIEHQLDKVEYQLNKMDHQLDKVEHRLDNIGEQIGDIIGIFKISEARHTQAEQRVEALAHEIKEQGRRTDETIQVQMQMLALMRATNAKVDGLDQRLGVVEDQTPRIQRLEDHVFRAAPKR